VPRLRCSLRPVASVDRVVDAIATSRRASGEQAPIEALWVMSRFMPEHPGRINQPI
jgi:hypothetical protein